MRNLRQSFARSTQAKRQQQKMKIALAAVAGVGLIVIGMPLLPKKYGIWLGQMTSWLPFQEQSSNEVNSPSEVLALGSQSATERSEKLEAIASGRKSLDRNRARYLLATEAITQKQGKQALSWLEKLEWDYPLLGPQILLKRAQAYEVMGDAAQAKSAWQDLLDTYGDRSTAPAALTALGRKSPKDWEAVIAKFPSHPAA